MDNYAYPVGTEVKFTVTDDVRIIVVGMAGTVVKSFAPNNGRNVATSDGRVVNVTTEMIQDAS